MQNDTAPSFAQGRHISIMYGFYGITLTCEYASNPRDIIAGVWAAGPPVRGGRMAKSAILISSDRRVDA